MTETEIEKMQTLHRENALLSSEHGRLVLFLCDVHDIVEGKEDETSKRILAAIAEIKNPLPHYIGAFRIDDKERSAIVKRFHEVLAILKTEVGKTSQHRHNKALHTDNLQSASLPFGCG